MIKIEAIIREEKFEDVKEALNAIEVNGMTVSQVMGCGAQRGYKELVRGTEVDVQMCPKLKFEIMVSDEEWEAKTITLTFDSNGGSTVNPVTAKFGTEVPAIDVPQKEGYTFTGWTPAVPNNPTNLKPLPPFQIYGHRSS